MSPVPEIRIAAVNDAAIRPHGSYVLYWMNATRRTYWNFALDRAIEWCRELHKPLVILEPLRCDYPWASERFHAFVLDGMAANAARLVNTAVRYYPYVETAAGAGRGLLTAMAKPACVVITDDFPAFFHPRMLQAAGRRLPVKLEKVDSNGLLPLRAAERVYPTAYSFRRFLQAELPRHWMQNPQRDALRRLPNVTRARLPQEVTTRWPSASKSLLGGKSAPLAALPIDHDVGATNTRGGSRVARQTLRQFLSQRFEHYADSRKSFEANTSELAAYLHFGHISPHEVFAAIVQQEGWMPDRVADNNSGKRSGWWNMRPCAEAFLDQLITWRELGYNMAHLQSDYDDFSSLPDWALRTLHKHADDPRPHVYSLQQLESAATHDPLWNAAQMQLVQDGRIHNYLRMLWGKNVLAWSPTPEKALEVLVHLNNKYALDGRDPNSYSGIFWCFGRYDRAWGPERHIFGTVRYMTSQNTARKLRVGDYVQRYAPLSR
jgi:deoxyribodipyrimidine photo-lyase